MKTIRIGVFTPLTVQLLDLATVDVLTTISPEYLSSLPMLPPFLSAAAPSVKVSYITTPTSFPHVPLTADATLRATHAYTDEAVRPGSLDVVIVPGPPPDAVYEEGALSWLRAQAESEGVDVLSVCTGIYICAAAGICEGRNVSGPRGLLDDLRRKYPGVRFEGGQRRWVRDGNFWSSGGVTNGNDLMAAYARKSGRWGNGPLVEAGLKLTEVGDRGDTYETGQGRFLVGVVWDVVRIWVVSLFKGGKAKEV